MTQFLTGSAPSEQAQIAVGVGAAVVAADTVMSFFGSMGNDSGFNAWINDNMTDDNRGQLGAAMATQPVLGTIFGTIIGGLLVGSDDNYMRLFSCHGHPRDPDGDCIRVQPAGKPPAATPACGAHSADSSSASFNFRKYGEMHELVWVNWTLTVFFIAFNVYFLHIGNFVIYYLGFTADQLGIIEGVSLILAMFSVIPATSLINRGRIPAVAAAGILLNCAGCSILALFVRPETVDTSTLFNPLLILGVFLIGTGYILFLQTITVWSKQLYPQDSRGQFEGIRILFFVLIPMIIAPLISNPVIRGSGKFTDADGFTEYLPTHTLYGISVFLVLAAFIPLAFCRPLVPQAATGRTFAFLKEVIPIFAECFRVLKPGGVLICGLDTGMNYITDSTEERIVNSLPYDPLRNPEQMKQLQDEGRLLELHIPSFIGTRAVKP
jgi:hypothetical protein